MREKKKSCSIYSIYGWMGVVGKYTGCHPLPGLYEKREWSKCTKAFINYVIPALNFIYLLFIFSMICFNYTFNRNNDLTDMLQVIIDVCIFAHFISCAVLNHLSLRRKLKTYLHLHLSVDDLLKYQQRRLKRFVGGFFVLFIVFQTVQISVFSSKDYMRTFPQHFYANPIQFQMLISSSIRLLGCCVVSLAIYAHPHLIYIVFQHILKSAFDQLFKEIEKNKTKDFVNGEKRVLKIREYMKLYGDLCRLSTRLDEMVSPLMLITFIGYYVKEIHSITYLFFVSTINVLSLANVVAVVSGIVPLIFVSNFAYLVKKSRDEILPVVYSTFNSNEKAVATELQNFALQSMYFNKSFSVSGFVQLDRQLIIAIFQSLISQVVVFYKIHREKVS